MCGATVASCAEGGPKQHRSETVSHSKSVSTPSATLSSVGAAASGSGGTPVEARGPNPRQKLFQLGGGLTAALGGWPSLLPGSSLSGDGELHLWVSSRGRLLPAAPPGSQLRSFRGLAPAWPPLLRRWRASLSSHPRPVVAGHADWQIAVGSRQIGLEWVEHM
jgi:hypothetical protein